MFIDGTYYLYHMRDRVNFLFKKDYKKTYLKILKGNFRALENKIRKGKGYDDVGSYFKEKLLYDKLRTEFPILTIHTQYSPSWLRPQRLDIYIVECNLAVEYHGAQHYLPIDFFGGEKGLELRKKLDNMKRERCLDNAIHLIEISYEEDFDFAFEDLKSIIVNLIK